MGNGIDVRIEDAVVGEEKGLGYKAELHDTFTQAAENFDEGYEIDFDTLAEVLVTTDVDTDYENKKHLLSNLAFLLENKSPSLTDKDLVFFDNKEVYEKLSTVRSQNNEYELDRLFTQVQEMLA